MIDCPNCGKQLMPDSSNPMRMKCTYCNYVLDPTADMDPLPGLFADETPAFIPSSSTTQQSAQPMPPEGQPTIPASSGQTHASYYMPPSGQPVAPPSGEPVMPPAGDPVVPPRGVPGASSQPGFAATQQSTPQGGSYGAPQAGSQMPPGMHPMQGAPVMQPTRLPKGMAIASMVLGILALLNCWIPFISIGGIVLGLLALIFGIVALVQFSNGKAGGKGLSIAGVACGGIALVIAIIVTVASFLAFRAFMDDYDIYYDDDRYTYDYDYDFPDGWDSQKYEDFMDSLKSQSGTFSDDEPWVNMSFTLDGKDYTLLQLTFDEFQAQSGWTIDLMDAGYPYGYIVQSGEEVYGIPVANASYPDVLLIVNAYNPSKDQRDLGKCQLSGVWVTDTSFTFDLKLPGGVGIGSNIAAAKEAYGEPFFQYQMDEEDMTSLSYLTVDLYKSLDLIADESGTICGINLAYMYGD